MSKESDKKEIHRILHRMVASPFRALLGDGGGTVDVAGKTGYVWARKLGQEGTVFQAYNRGVSATNEGRVVLVQGSRVEGLPGYEVVGSAGGDYIDLSGHVATEPFDAHIGNPVCRVYRSTAQSIPRVAVTPLSWDVAVANIDNMWTSVSPTRIYVKVPGYYIGGGDWIRNAANNPNATRHVARVRMNGTVYISQGETHTIANKECAVGTSSGPIQMVVGDYIEVVVYHDDPAAARDATAGSSTSQQTNTGFLVRVG